MAEILTIPKKLAQRGDLVVLPRADYEAMLKMQARLLWEENDTDEAIRVFEQEKRNGTLKKVANFSSMLRSKKARR